LGSTYAAIFLAELGDKTQLSTLALATGKSRWEVFLGAGLALLTTTALAVLAGDAVARVVPPVWIRRGAGLLFLTLGAVFLLSRGD
jgi:putative Ca2+/H+ antiporter (TMEM165/GDT1 family)